MAGRQIHSFLAPNDRVPGARLLVVEGWLDTKELDQAVAAFQQGRYQRVVTTGGPMETWSEFPRSSNYADYAASYLRKHGLQHVDLTAVPAPASAQDRTFLSAVKVRDWAKMQGLEVSSLDVYSSGTHARRSRMLYRIAFGPNIDVGILSARPTQYDDERWWQTSAGVKTVLGETISLVWTTCWFHPAPPGSHEELWAVPRQGG